MTSEEIKQQYSMRDVAAMYGIYPDRSGMIHCPFHRGDREASMKIYKKDFHCFGCGANGDIFSFVQQMDNLTFKEAFAFLGGTYEQSAASRFRVYHAKKQREMNEKAEIAKAEKKRINCDLITVYRRWIRKLAPFSDAWCDCQNELTRQIGIFEELNELR